MLKTPISHRLEKPAYDLEALRELFPVTKELTYLNHGAVSPQAIPVQQAQRTMIDIFGRGTAGMPMEKFFEVYNDLKMVICQLINAEPDEIALVQNTGLGMNIIALGLNLPAWSNVILCDVEYPANVYPWMSMCRGCGAELRQIPADNGGLTVEALDKYADQNTKLVTVSSLQYATGHLTDLQAIGEWCREREIMFCVDGIQSVAHDPIDVKAAHIDFLATGGMKSLMGPMGIGFLYIRRELLAEHGPSLVSTSSMTNPMDFGNIHWEIRTEAARYELGTPNIIGIAGLKAAIEMLLSLGVENIGAWTQSLAAALMDDLTRRGYDVITPHDSHGSIVIFATPTLEDDLKKLTEANIVMIDRGGNLRASLHCYNTYEEIYRVGEVLGDK